MFCVTWRYQALAFGATRTIIFLITAFVNDPRMNLEYFFVERGASSVETKLPAEGHRCRLEQYAICILRLFFML